MGGGTQNKEASMEEEDVDQEFNTLGQGVVEKPFDVTVTQNDGSSDEAEVDSPAEEDPTPPSSSSSSTTSVSHFRREDLSSTWRYGVPIYLILVLILLIVGEVVPAIKAIMITIPAPNDRWSDKEETVIADDSIWTSVEILWESKSYALTCLLVVGSIAWPLVKILATLYAWMAPITNLKKRQTLLQVLDITGKWSFAFLIVVAQIVVSVRATIPIGGGAFLEVYMFTRPGLDCFILATVLSILGGHVTLHLHRQYAYNNNHNHNNNALPSPSRSEPEQAAVEAPSSETATTTTTTTTTTPIFSMGQKSILLVILIAGIVVYIYGCFVDVFEISKARPNVETVYQQFSVVNIGELYAESTQFNEARDKWIQFLWFFLAMVMPIASTLMMILVLLVPNSKAIFMAAEMAFAWNCADVVILSTIFAVVRIPEFGDVLVDSGCDSCYEINTELTTVGIVLLCVGMVANAVVGIYMHRKLHPVLFRREA